MIRGPWWQGRSKSVQSWVGRSLLGDMSSVGFSSFVKAGGPLGHVLRDLRSEL